MGLQIPSPLYLEGKGVQSNNTAWLGLLVSSSRSVPSKGCNILHIGADNMLYKLSLSFSQL